jgi:hypothetical protein
MSNYNYETKEPKKVTVFTEITADVDLTSVAHAGAEMVGKCARWLTVIGPGVLVVKDQSGDTVTLPSAPAGHRWFGQWSAIVDAGTDATDIVAKW